MAHEATVAPRLFGPDGATAQISPVQQWWTLTGRGLRKVVRNGEIVLAFLSPALLALCFYLPLRKIMNAQMDMNYAQYLMPIIFLQSLEFTASSAAMRSSFDGSEGVNTRFRAMPMRPAVPLLARTATNAVLLTVSLVCATVATLIMGWRPGGGVTGTLALYGIGALIGLLLATVADGIGLIAGSPQATSQTMGLPTLILGMLSTGFVPEERFPEWIRPFARNQPISQFAGVMRSADDGTLTWHQLFPSVCWMIGLAVVAAILLGIYMRRNAR
ncbi:MULTISPECIES: ABC transporter permease [Gordonia]|uniref:Daunorubicin ABC transporter ATP-binding protein DrrA n=2 Tax=Gordonia TaxID=2053 RepID=A0ABN3H7H1_9ACTN|nr:MULTISPECIES: ABC transporter permease [Gordonia]AUH68158.1 ABC transporter [Gordonia sp. YC-JH1]KXT58786.1 ABC transporter [Gordonia sp. QH-12]MBY4570101.1 ABC transporter [Gordonia sihwensis]WFN92097.1 ABC transporter permease [Gordonia sihwensis]GAC60292.1 putative ABC transporter permease protein [Gordonia sihwensis NBRC 108236]